MKAVIIIWALALSVLQSLAFDFIGHRGDPELAPQNSVESFKSAWKNSTYAEGDFYEIASGEIICLHGQPEWKKVSGREAKIASLSISEIKSVNLADTPKWREKYADVRIPTLDEVLAVLPKGKILVFEVKNYSPTYAGKIEAARKKYNLDKDQIIFISFNKKAIKSLNSKLKGYKSLWLSSVSPDKEGKLKPSPEEVLKVCRDIGASGVDMGGAKHLNSEYVSKIRSAGLDFWAWTVNDFNLALKLRDMGVQFVTTDKLTEFQKRLK